MGAINKTLMGFNNHMNNKVQVLRDVRAWQADKLQDITAQKDSLSALMKARSEKGLKPMPEAAERLKELTALEADYATIAQETIRGAFQAQYRGK